jgi:hypothetical protein
MVTSTSYKNDSGEDLPSFSDPEDYNDEVSNEGYLFESLKFNFNCYIANWV